MHDVLFDVLAGLDAGSSKTTVISLNPQHCGCYCGAIRYEVKIEKPEDARTSICHCNNCKKFTGGPFGETTRVPMNSLSITKGHTKAHIADNGTGTALHREFCAACGGPILEFGEPAAEKFRYIFTGTFDEPSVLPPTGEFFCKRRERWMPEVEGTFKKQEIKE